MGDRRSQALAAALAALLGALIAGGSVAPAGISMPPGDGDDLIAKSKGVRYSFDGRLADAGSAEAGCEVQPWRLTGSGAALTGTTLEAALAGLGPVAFGDSNDKPDDGSFAFGSGSDGAAVTAAAVCVRTGSMRYVRRELPPVTESPRVAAMSCGGGRWHVTGGGAYIDTAGSWVGSSYPYDGSDRNRQPDDGWKVHVLDLGAEGFFVFAYCTKSKRLTYRQTKPVTIATADDLTRRARCQRKSSVIGGGARVGGLINRGRIYATLPYDSGDQGNAPDDGWRASAQNLSGGEERTLKTFAICQRPKGGKG